ncbi:hypothetical protein [Dickeya dadantii]|nr:hypothetical protein [Dickeya dadantii]
MTVPIRHGMRGEQSISANPAPNRHQALHPTTLPAGCEDNIQ